ncbi:MAG: tRNA pseudouridine(38-40) synthase TruA [Clostridia bacterium]|nr:tRNA pseudouridine(38-40) synthase TruA [Clostridia bacterium]
MRNIRLTIEYDGKDFNGWQKQPNKLNIQGEIERAIESLTGDEKVDLIASGRTDAGVHALGQVANFKTNNESIPIEKFAMALNTKLKRSIRVIYAEEVDERFHSRYTCKRKTYRYVINNNECESAIYRNFEYHMPVKLNVEAMKKAIKYFEGEHDFKAFKASGTSSKSSIRTIYLAEVKEAGHGRIYIELTGNGFLYNMVRIIAGTLVDVGMGKIPVENIPEIIAEGDRSKAGKTLSPSGLFLMKVEY